MSPATQNRFGFPTPSQHVSMGAALALVKAAGTKEPLNVALETISRIEQTPVKVAPRPVESKEIAPACKKFYDQLSIAGSAAEILNVARLNRYFRAHYPAAVKWAKSQKPQTPIIT